MGLLFWGPLCSPQPFPASSLGEVTPRALRPGPQPRARSAGGGGWATRVLCAVGKPEWAPCPRRGLSSPSSGPHCRRPRLWAEAGWWSRRGTHPAGGRSQGRAREHQPCGVFPAQASFLLLRSDKATGGLQPCGAQEAAARCPGVTRTHVAPGRLHGPRVAGRWAVPGRGPARPLLGVLPPQGSSSRASSSSSPPVADRGSACGLGVLPAHKEKRPDWLRLGP